MTWNVLDFGADPTGATDSRTAINAAITAAQATPGGNGCVYFPSGTYAVEAPLAGSISGISLAGDGPNQSQIVFTNQTGYCLETVDDVISDLGLYLSDASGTGLVQAIGSTTMRDVQLTGTGTNDPTPLTIPGSGPYWFDDVMISSVSLASGQSAFVVIDNAMSPGDMQLSINSCVVSSSTATADPNMAIFYLNPAAAAGPPGSLLDFEIRGTVTDLGSTYNYGAYVVAGNVDHYVIVDNDFSRAAISPVFDGGTGTNKLVNDNPIRTGGGADPASPNTWSAPQTFNVGEFKDKGGLVFDVTAYGAVGDGSTDDTASINAAIAALNTNLGGILFFPQVPNFYKISGSGLTTLSAGNTLVLGNTGVEIQGNGITGSRMWDISGDNITMQGLKLQSSAAITIVSIFAANVRVRDCNFNLCDGGARVINIGETGSDEPIWITDCYFTGCNAGPSSIIVVDSGATGCTWVERNHFKNCTANGTSTSALISTNSSNFHIMNNNAASGAFNNGVIVVTGASDNYTITNNDFHTAAIAAIADNGTGSNKLVNDNLVRV